jgi:transposase
MVKDLYRQGLSISEIARRTGHDRKTVRAVLKGPVRAAPRPRQPRARKLDPYAPYLEKRLGEGVLNAQKLYQEIAAQGYRGKERAVRAFVHPHREAARPQATLRYETEPGQQAQVDWGTFGAIEHGGQRRRLYAFVMTLGWSRAMFLEFTVAADTVRWLRCHVHAFHYFGGVPREVLHDNLKTAVLSRPADGAIHWHPRYLDLADYYGFRPRACQPYRPQTKGKVESSIRYVRGNFWSGLVFRDLADLNRQARHWLETVANCRVHGTTREVPWERLPAEGLQSLAGKPDFDTSRISYRHSSRDCLVSYGGNYYSVPATHARQALLLRETEQGEVHIFTLQGQPLARHRLVPGRHQRVVVTDHFEDLSLARRPARRPGAVQLRLATPFNLTPGAPEVEVRPLDQYEQWLEAGV